MTGTYNSTRVLFIGKSSSSDICEINPVQQKKNLNDRFMKNKK